MRTKNILLFALIVFAALLLYLASFVNYFTHDDFFVFAISNANSLGGFLKYFYESPGGWGLYRPISTQVFYTLSRILFGYNPFWIHVVLFGLFIAILILIYNIVFRITKNFKISYIATFLYATSATHFGQLYFPATQEIWVAFFYLLSVWFFLKYELHNKLYFYCLSILLFVLALMSKESALTLLFVLPALHWLLNKKINLKRLLFRLTPFVIITLGYLVFRFYYYGFTSGDSYIWDFSPRIVNTVMWYLLWSFNIPEMLVDFVGPGLNINPNLIKYWGRDMLFILTPFIGGIAMIVYKFITLRNWLWKNYKIILFGMYWFIVTLVTVIFLPLHKFSFYLTIPLIGLVVIIAKLFEKSLRSTVIIFCLLWVLVSYATLNLTRNTHWITRGAQIAGRVTDYISKEVSRLSTVKTIVFCDTVGDEGLPWKPTKLIKDTLSGNNYFLTVQMGKYSVEYLDKCRKANKNEVMVQSRRFLGY